MGFSVNNLEEIQEQLQNFDEEPEFVALILYKEVHKEFKYVFRQNFYHYHMNSNKYIHFFVFDNIVSKYTNQYTSSRIVNEKVVDTIKSKFNLSNKDLPAVILTKNLDSSEYAVVNFSEFQNIDEIHEILKYIFIPFAIKESTYEVEYKINSIKNKWNNISYQSFSPDWMEFGSYSEKVSLRNKLLAALEEANILLEDLRNKLDAIQIEHEILFSRKKEASGILAEEEYSKLTDEIFKVQQHLAFRLSQNLDEDLVNPKQNLSDLEPESIEMINSCLLLSNTIKSLGARSFDYTLFVAGYWKALENELTVIIRDVLLYLNEYINDVPYTKKLKLQKNENYYLTWKFRSGNKVVNIFKNNDVENLTLGSARLVLQNYSKNDYGNLFVKKYNKDALENDFNEFIPKLNILVNFRNDYSHKKIMNEATYRKIFKLIFEEKLLDKTIELKKIAKNLPSIDAIHKNDYNK